MSVRLALAQIILIARPQAPDALINRTKLNPQVPNSAETTLNSTQDTQYMGIFPLIL